MKAAEEKSSMSVEKIKIHPEHFHKKTKLKLTRPVTLRRDLTLFQATMAGVAIIVGAGI